MFPIFLQVLKFQLRGFVEKYPVAVTAKKNVENGLKAFLKTLSENKSAKVSEPGKKFL